MNEVIEKDGRTIKMIKKETPEKKKREGIMISRELDKKRRCYAKFEKKRKMKEER
jgi:hypothetical protein